MDQTLEPTDSESLLWPLRSPVAGGTFEYHSEVEFRQVPYGPKSLQSLASWPKDMVRTLAADGEAGALRGQRLMSLFRNGVVMHSDCTGRMTAEGAMRMLAVAMAQNGLKIRKDWLVVWRGCDLSVLSQKLMMESEAHGPLHVFPSLQGRLPAEAEEHLNKQRPAKEASQVIKAQANHELLEYLLENRGAFFGPSKTSHTCLKHVGKKCGISFQPKDVPEDVRPLSMAFISPPCTPWTSMGAQTNWAHEAMETVLVGLVDVSSNMYDIIGIEETDKFPLELMMEIFPHEYLLLPIRFGPPDLGFPIRRPRLMVMAIRQDRVCWIGPAAKDLLKEFMGLFGRAVYLESDDFARVDTQANLDSELLEAARAKGIYADLEVLQGMHLSKLLPSGQASHLKVYEEVWMSRKMGVRGSFMADASQDPLERPRCGAWFPSLARSTMLRSVTSNHAFTKNEIDFSMGFPSLDFPECKPYQQCFEQQVTSMNRHQYGQLSGNGIHVGAGLTFWTYVLSHCVKRADVEKFSPPIRPAEEVEVTEVEGEEADK
jgi:hypothetical protein